eukprot:6187169-Pleurochrysis_carterae.AAC.5
MRRQDTQRESACRFTGESGGSCASELLATGRRRPRLQREREPEVPLCVLGLDGDAGLGVLPRLRVAAELEEAGGAVAPDDRLLVANGVSRAQAQRLRVQHCRLPRRNNARQPKRGGWGSAA